MSVVTRIAPSPTGEPHVGTAYVALFNWAWARRHGGRFILRVEDTDRERSRPEHEAGILDALDWLGLVPDESPAAGGPHGPYRQSERGAIYAEHVQRLIDGGHAYRCFCTPERLERMRAEQKRATGSTRYDGRCRTIPADEAARRAREEPHVVRLAVDPGGSTTFEDLLRGEITIAHDNIDDQVLLKSDGMPTYHLACVVDDHLMGVTLILRAEEWLPSVPKHVLLHRAFGWTMPDMCHVPLLRNADKSKISKRKNPTSVLWYRRRGYLPEALLNFLGLMGWRPEDDELEAFDLDFFVRHFDPKDIGLGGPVFDLEKLEWLNGVKIRELAPEELAERLAAEGFAGAWTRDDVVRVAPLVQPRMRVLPDFVEIARYLVERVEPDLDGLARKARKADPEVLRRALLEAADRLEADAALDEQEREDRLRSLAEQHGLKVGALFMGLRVAITGATASPPILPSVDVMGANEAAARVRDLVARLPVARE